jgi:SOS-response transcriptional repressor LexA
MSQLEVQQTTEAVYTFLTVYIETHGYSPSYREIARACYIAMGSVPRYLDKLEIEGRINRTPGQARSIHLISS